MNLTEINSCNFDYHELDCQIAEELDEANVVAWERNYCALAVFKRLGLEETGGMARVGTANYNTLEEIKKFDEVLARIVANLN